MIVLRLETAAPIDAQVGEATAVLNEAAAPTTAPSVQVADVSIDQEMAQKVDEERVRKEQDDLLNSASPQE